MHAACADRRVERECGSGRAVRVKDVVYRMVPIDGEPIGAACVALFRSVRLHDIGDRRWDDVELRHVVEAAGMVSALARRDKHQADEDDAVRTQQQQLMLRKQQQQRPLGGKITNEHLMDQPGLLGPIRPEVAKSRNRKRRASQ
jgi:hypothetical protein